MTNTTNTKRPSPTEIDAYAQRMMRDGWSPAMARVAAEAWASEVESSLRRR